MDMKLSRQKRRKLSKTKLSGNEIVHAFHNIFLSIHNTILDGFGRGRGLSPVRKASF